MKSALPATHHYSLSGLEVSSEFRLPELNTSPASVLMCQARIRLDSVSDTPFSENDTWFIDESDFHTIYMKIEGVARYLIRNGNEILIDPLPGASEREIRLFLLGSAFGILLHQRGILPLHASAINVNGRCIAFIGESGAGKSTLAAFLKKSGYQVICDDVCALTINDNGKPVIWPGVPRLKLWQDALEVLGYDSCSLVQDSYQENKYHMPLNIKNNKVPLNLACIYELKNDRVCQIDNLSGQEKMRALVNNIYRGEFVTSGNIREKNFSQCATIVKSVSMFSFSRPRYFQSMSECLSELEKHWTENMSEIIK